MSRVALIIATACGIGLIPFAPGTFGSLPGIAIALLARRYGGAGAEIVTLVAIVLAGVWASNVAERHFGRSDPGAVVVDEVAGMMVTIALLPLSGTGLVAAFLLFRACDIVKPYPSNRLERLSGGLGVMSDDLMAGVWAHAIVRGLAWLLPQWMLA